MLLQILPNKSYLVGIKKSERLRGYSQTGHEIDQYRGSLWYTLVMGMENDH